MESNNYCEVLVKVQASKGEQLAGKLLWVLTAVFLLVSVVFLFFGVVYLVCWLLTLISLVGALLWGGKLNQEYEYEYIDGSLRIDRVIANRKRKKCGWYELENLVLAAPEGDESLTSYGNREGLKRLDYSSHNPAAPNRYQMVFSHELVTLEPTEELIRLLWRAAPQKVKRKKAAVL